MCKRIYIYTYLYVNHWYFFGPGRFIFFFLLNVKRIDASIHTHVHPSINHSMRVVPAEVHFSVECSTDRSMDPYIHQPFHQPFYEYMMVDHSIRSERVISSPQWDFLVLLVVLLFWWTAGASKSIVGRER